MGNYFEGDLYFYVRKDTPINILNDLITKVDANLHCRCMWSPSAHIIYLYGCIGKTPHWIKEEIIPENINEYDYFVVSVSICTKYYISNKVEDYLIYIRDKLYPYCKDLEKIKKLSIEDFEASLNEWDGINYIGTISDEDHTYHKIFVWDDSILNKAIKSREYICKDCKFVYHSAVYCSKYRNDPLCSRFDACKRAYLIGAEKGAKQVVDFYDSKEQKLKSTLDNIESRLDNILSKIQTDEGVENE